MTYNLNTNDEEIGNVGIQWYNGKIIFICRLYIKSTYNYGRYSFYSRY